MISIENCLESGYEGLYFYEKFANCRLHDYCLKLDQIKLSKHFDQTYFQKFYSEIYN